MRPEYRNGKGSPAKSDTQPGETCRGHELADALSPRASGACSGKTGRMSCSRRYSPFSPVACTGCNLESYILSSHSLSSTPRAEHKHTATCRIVNCERLPLTTPGYQTFKTCACESCARSQGATHAFRNMLVGHDGRWEGLPRQLAAPARCIVRGFAERKSTPRVCSPAGAETGAAGLWLLLL